MIRTNRFLTSGITTYGERTILRNYVGYSGERVILGNYDGFW